MSLCYKVLPFIVTCDQDAAASYNYFVLSFSSLSFLPCTFGFMRFLITSFSHLSHLSSLCCQSLKSKQAWVHYDHIFVFWLSPWLYLITDICIHWCGEVWENYIQTGNYFQNLLFSVLGRTINTTCNICTGFQTKNFHLHI